MKQAEIEKKVLDFWKKDTTFQKSLEKESPKGDYVFYDGPPFATGTPHYGHIVASLIKDMVPRFWTMQGYHVDRKWGWDCHGLPIENIVEQAHGFKHKKDILNYGVDKFNEDARSRVLQYADEWKTVIDRLGRWVDMENDYKTMDPEFMESVWWVFKELHEKGLLYEAYRSMHICPRCETTLAQSEVAQGYKDVKDLSVTAKFKLKNIKDQTSITKKIPNFNNQEIFLLAWTTTPWTLPGNMALAVGGDINYFAVQNVEVLDDKVLKSEIFIFADSPDTRMHVFGEGCKEVYSDREVKGVKELTGFIASSGEEYRIVSEKLLTGKDLIGLTYEPLFPYYDNEKLEGRENAFKVYAGDFVNTEDGTGIVHIAPAFGTDDYVLSQKENIPFVQHVHMDGTFKDEVTDFAGLSAKHQDAPNTKDHLETEVEPTDVQIIKYLAKHDTLFSKQKFEHSYPHCWRCDSPLLNYATSSWFVSVEKIKDDLLKNAEDINWVPEHIKTGRFGQWLEGARDWSISRQRFWGSVLPIWKCSGENNQTSNSKNQEKTNNQKPTTNFSANACSNMVVVGSVDELEKLSGEKVTDLHKHFVDDITFTCSECSGTMKRIPDVLDCWFEAGSMPYGQMHYPFENEDTFEQNFPAQFIAEGVDQTRAWFYYLHVLATALKNKPAFKNVIVNGIVLAEDGRKMSKRLQNYPDPMDMFEKYGADAVRYYLASSPVMRTEDFRFSEKEVEEVVKKVHFIAYNVLSLYKMNASDAQEKNVEPDHILDKWIVARTEQVTQEITNAYTLYDLNRATRPLLPFINEVSTWYVRRSRDRIKDADASALATLRFVLQRIALLSAPVMPFTAEHIYQELGETDSVHLAEWPAVQEIDTTLLEQMEEVRSLVETGHALRAKAGMKVRQTLASVKVAGNVLDALKPIMAEELNVQEVQDEADIAEQNGWIIDEAQRVSLDTNLTEELKELGTERELVRTINAMRKKQSLTRDDVINVKFMIVSGVGTTERVIEKYSEELKNAVIADTLVLEENDGEEFKINDEVVKFKLNKR